MVLAHCCLGYVLRLYDLACPMLKLEFSKKKNTFYENYEIFSVAFKATRKKRVSKHLQSDINFFYRYVHFVPDRSSHALECVTFYLITGNTCMNIKANVVVLFVRAIGLHVRQLRKERSTRLSLSSFPALPLYVRNIDAA